VERPPAPYFSHSEEPVVLKHHISVIQGDPSQIPEGPRKRNPDQQLETSSAETGKVVFSSPQQILNSSKIDLEESNTERETEECGYTLSSRHVNGLPTNHRLFYGDSSTFRREICLLCLMGSKEDIDHPMLICPALPIQESDLNTALQADICQMETPYFEAKADFKGKMCPYLDRPLLRN